MTLITRSIDRLKTSLNTESNRERDTIKKPRFFHAVNARSDIKSLRSIYKS